MTAATASTPRKYRFYRHDFEPLVTKPLHLDLAFDVLEHRVEVTQKATYVYNGQEPLSTLKLNSKALEVKSVERYNKFKELGNSKDFVGLVASLGEPSPQKYEVDKKDDFLVIHLSPPVEGGKEFSLKIVTVATPTENILEGLYYDFTPEGKPRTIITQCQQYGFQRIVPCTDTMDAKTYYTTTILADKRYSNVITNGDLAPGYFDEQGKPIYHDATEFLGKKDDTRHVIKYYNHLTSMAPYLFFFGVGTWITYRKELEYPDGDSFFLELLVYPGRCTPQHARESMWMMHDSIQWNLVATGPESTERVAEKERIMELIKEREAIKAKQGETVTSSEEPAPSLKPLSEDDSQRLSSIRGELAALIKKWKKTGYKYTGAIYREIAMENSNYGGMENVGNTTIVSAVIAPSKNMTDQQYMYQEGVKIHEFYHNINGSEVTGQSPFEIWLNEAVTVHIQRQREAELFGEDFMRLSTLQRAFTPVVGPIAQDRTATSMSIEPVGFNQTQELVSAVTYSKAPEVVRMTELLCTKPVFNKGLDHYYTKYRYGNATTMDWFRCMEEASGLDLKNFQEGWLKRTGYPDLEYKGAYDSNTGSYTVELKQKGFEDFETNNQPWEIPVDWALIKDGAVISQGVYRFVKAEDQLIIEGISQEPDYISVARGWSFFGKIKNVGPNAYEEQVKQALSDPDAANKFFAYRAIADAEKAKVIEALLAKKTPVEISPEFVDLFAKILFNEDLSFGCRALMLSEGDSIPSRPDLEHHYRELSSACSGLFQAVWDAHSEQIYDLYNALKAASEPGPFLSYLPQRQLRVLLLGLMAAGSAEASVIVRKGEPIMVDFPAVARHVLEHSAFMTEKAYALRKFLESSASQEDKSQVQKKVRDEWCEDDGAWATYIPQIAVLDTEDVCDQVRQLMKDPKFVLSRAAHARNICGAWGSNRKRSLLTDDGLNLTVDMLLTVGKVNEMSAYAILRAFDGLAKMDKFRQEKLIAALKRMRDGLDATTQKSLYNQLSMILEKC